jgi:hypothetical protein
MTPEVKARLQEALLTLGEEEISDQDAHQAILRLIPRWKKSLHNAGIGVAIPCAPGRSVTEETLACVAKGLACDLGLTPLTVQSFEIANNREHLLKFFLDAGYHKLLFLDSDTVIDVKGLDMLVETMARWDAAMVAALVFQRYVASDGVYNAFILDADGRHKPLLRADLPQSLTAFPVEFCGLACALLDLDKIRNVAQTVEKETGEKIKWFRRVAEGFEHAGEDVAFCGKLKEHNLDFVVDPRVSTIHAIQHRFLYSPAVAK